MASLASQQQAAAIYYAVFGRNASADAYDFFGRQLETASRTPTELTQALLNSSDGKSKYAGQSDSQIISQIYNKIFGTNPTDSQVNTLLANGSVADAAAKLVTDLLSYNGTDTGVQTQQSNFTATVNTALFPVAQTSATAGASDIQALYYSLGQTQVQSGITYWGTQLASGKQTFAQVAQGFATSSPALKALSNADFVKFVFANLYERDGTAAELATYTANLNSGATRGDVLTSIISSIRGPVSTSDATAQSHFNGATKVYAPGELPALSFQEQAASIYLAVPDRGIDARALDTWSKSLASGTTFSNLTTKLLASSEFQAKGAQLTGNDFIQHVYTAVYGVPATADQKNHKHQPMRFCQKPRNKLPQLVVAMLKKP